jgi:hypothetical protein
VPIEQKAEEVVKKVLENLNDRRGYRQVWDGIDKDVRDEILQTLKDIVSDCLMTEEV